MHFRLSAPLWVVTVKQTDIPPRAFYFHAINERVTLISSGGASSLESTLSEIVERAAWSVRKAYRPAEHLLDPRPDATIAQAIVLPAMLHHTSSSSMGPARTWRQER